MSRRGLTLLACLACACQAPPFGEVLVVADTDVSVPRLVGRLRVDLYAADGSWYESRDVAAPSARDWPLSFSLVTDEHTDRDVRLRLRAYPEGGLRDYRGERFVAPHPPFNPPAVAKSLTELCANAPLLAPGVDLTQRRGAEPLTEADPQNDCIHLTQAGAVAVRVQIAQAGSYRFEVVRSVPDASGGLNLAGDSTLLLRTSCETQGSQLGCNDDQSPMNFNARLVIALQPGAYWLLTGGSQHSPADLTLRWSLASDWSTPAPPDGGAGPDPPLPLDEDPRLRDAQGIDITPALEPQPNLSIDRLVDVKVRHGERRTLAITLGGECLGTMADLAGARTCVDSAGALAPVIAPNLPDGIDRGGTSASGTWAAEAPLDCAIAPRERHQGADGDDLFDEEVCVPGGVVTLGDRRLVGFTPMSNADVVDGSVAAACTWPGEDALGPEPFRERLPLNCISWYAARALCEFFGGSLLSSAEWEWAAGGDGQDHEVSFPWGDHAPTTEADCTQTVFGRAEVTGIVGVCPSMAERPEPVDAAPWAQNDVTASGLVLMGGNVSEWTLDSDRLYSDPCWWQHSLRQVGCTEEESLGRNSHGGSFIGHAVNLHVATTAGGDPNGVDVIGLRCARRGRP